MKYFVFIVSILVIAFACTKDQSDIFYGNYPKEVGKIIITKCANKGCHDDNSFKAAGSLNLSTWNKLFEGSPIGSVVIGGRSDLSSLCYFINADNDGNRMDSLLPAVKPFMPFNQNALSYNEYSSIKEWIDNGALNANGEKRFDTESIKEKYYVVNQGCDEVCVMDAKTGLPYKYVKVGLDPNSIESPHMVKVSPDGKYWYVCFLGSSAGTSIFQKFDATTDKFVANCTLKDNGVSILGTWNVFTIHPSGKEACVSDFSPNGYIVRVNLETMETIQTYKAQSGVHGVTYNQFGDTLYAMELFASRIIRIFINEPGEFDLFDLPGSANQAPHQINFRPDFKYFFVTCQGTNDVRVFDAATNALVKTIKTGNFPQEMAMSKKRNLLFVTCTEDLSLAAPRTKGIVSIIDMNTLTLVQNIVDVGYEPHGIAVDDNNNNIIVASRNTGSAGPAPHHSTNCGGRNGFVTIFDLNTFQKTKRRIELLQDPYSVAFKSF